MSRLAKYTTAVQLWEMTHPDDEKIPTDYRVNPGDLEELDDECLEWLHEYCHDQVLAKEEGGLVGRREP